MRRLPLYAISALLLTACGEAEKPAPPDLRAEQVHALIKANTRNKSVEAAWASDMLTALRRLEQPRDQTHACALIAVIEQESGFDPDPPVAGLPAMVNKRLKQTDQHTLVKTALALRLKQTDRDGKSFAQTLELVRTERDLENWYHDFTAAYLTNGILKLLNKDIDALISTVGSMQVSVQFARDFAKQRGLQIANMRAYLYTREGGVFFGAAHLLAYPRDYSNWSFSFADYNAGHYASRNAGFQKMVARLSGARLDLDGDLLAYPDDGVPKASVTAEKIQAVLSKAGLAPDDDAIFADLKLEKAARFVETATYRRIADLHRQRYGQVVKEALPQIRLQSDKIQRRLTTAWFAERVHWRFNNCMRTRLPR